MDRKLHIINHLQGRLSLDVKTITQSLLRPDGSPYPARYLKPLIDEYISCFLKQTATDNRWLVVPGLRGVGKTTLLRQIYLDLLNQQLDINLLYITLDQLVDSLDANLYEILKAYEDILGTELSTIEKPTFIFIDEVQADPKWARILKAVYDNNRSIFLFCAGSAATHLQMDADIAGRRAQPLKLHPLSFAEYQLLSNQQPAQSGLKQQIIQALYHAKDGKDSFEALNKLKPQVHQAWLKYPRQSLNAYLKTGTLPCTLSQPSESSMQTSLLAMLDKVIETDLRILKQLEASSCQAIRRLLFRLSGTAEAISAVKLAQSLGVSRSQIFNFLDLLVKAELLIKIPAYSSSLKNYSPTSLLQIHKSSSPLFLSGDC